ncbi:acyltransferase domain-containing protein [Streptomyces leeuwenhoekii]|uniref:Oleandomycin polyketide synthase, modules 5 and 6 n=1 Tax=Streptomyces leeuwenhoekii TaxID=1437453 RepID=A0A0F7VYZ4_STRLW|nr:acyltransferase domain-containing protein [Streptomyces leeuwenhoekii]CQR65744.1 Oleandomycin polyketide synthase, modules 5 and 6 [Streptomyces leeuwenhoekii]
MTKPATQDVRIGSGAGAVPWVLSGRSAAGLRAQAARLAARLEADSAASVMDGVTEVGRSLVAAGTAHEHRAVVLGRDRADLLSGVRALAEERAAANVVRGRADRRAGAQARPVFVFPGQGTQWVGMAVGLLDTSPLFAREIRACGQALSPYVDWSLEDVLRGVPGTPPLDRVDVVQPVLFSMMVSLARLWHGFGVEPGAAVGHSQGEIAAAHVAGALSLEDAARVVALRSQALTEIRGRGEMLTVLAPNDQVRTMLAGWDGALSVAAVNGPATMTVSGDLAAMAEFGAALSAAGMMRWRVPGVDFAAHSAHVESLRETLLDLAAGIGPRPSEVPFYSTVTGRRVDTAGLDAEYWYRNLRQTVRFDEAVRALLADGHKVFIECSAQPVLTVGMQDTVEQLGGSAVLMATLRNEDGGTDRFLAALAEAYVNGVAVDWTPAFA